MYTYSSLHSIGHFSFPVSRIPDVNFVVPRSWSLKNQSLQSKRSYYLRSLQSTEPLKKFVHFSTDFLQFKSIDHFIQQFHFNRFWKETTIWTLTKHPPIYLSFHRNVSLFLYLMVHVRMFPKLNICCLAWSLHSNTQGFCKN